MVRFLLPDALDTQASLPQRLRSTRRNANLEGQDRHGGTADHRPRMPPLATSTERRELGIRRVIVAGSGCVPAVSSPVWIRGVDRPCGSPRMAAAAVPQGGLHRQSTGYLFDPGSMRHADTGGSTITRSVVPRCGRSSCPRWPQPRWTA